MMDFISTQCPSSITSISVTSSQKKIFPGRPNTTALLYTYAVMIATEMRTIIPGRRDLSSMAKPFRKGDPPYRNTAVESPNRTYRSPGKRSASPRPSTDWINGESRRTGTVSASETQNRFLKSATMWAW